jgi:uncharacterized protein YjbI with pentapeptide repeats
MEEKDIAKMFRRHSVPISLTTKNNFIINKIQKPNYREWMKCFFSALVPLMIAVFTVVTAVLQQNLSLQQREQDKQDALLLRQQSERQADNIRKETVFATYLDDVSKLLLMENETQILIHIRMKTLTSLRQLDPELKQRLLLFLYESELIYNDDRRPIPSLLKLNYADFNDIVFKGTIENRCSFLHLYLREAYLSNSLFIGCYIDRSTFSNAIMYKATFFKTLLLRSSFRSALLDKANFSYSKLNIMDFCGASLVGSDFTGAILVRDGVNLINTNLTGAIISNKQISNTTFYNCILPNGTWGPIYTKNLIVNGDVEENVSIYISLGLQQKWLPVESLTRFYFSVSLRFTTDTLCNYKHIKL